MNLQTTTRNIQSAIINYSEAAREKCTELQAYCHVEGCLRISECPEACECGAKTGLDTAIAWETTEVTAKFMHAVLNYEWEGNYMSLKMLLERIDTFLDVLAYHSTEYPHLMGLVDGISDIMTGTLSTISRQIPRVRGVPAIRRKIAEVEKELSYPQTKYGRGLLLGKKEMLAWVLSDPLQWKNLKNILQGVGV